MARTRCCCPAAPESEGWMGQRSQVRWERPLMFSLTTGIKLRTQLHPSTPTLFSFFFFLKELSQGGKFPLIMYVNQHGGIIVR